jgi:hypothetical protein
MSECLVSVVASTTGKSRDGEPLKTPLTLIRETRGKETREAFWDNLPHRDRDFVVVPLYSGQ